MMAFSWLNIQSEVFIMQSAHRPQDPIAAEQARLAAQIANLDALIEKIKELETISKKIKQGKRTRSG